MEKIKIKSISSYNANIIAPPDKSITHRAVMFNAAAMGKSVIKNALMGQDCISTIECMQKLGAKISISGCSVLIEGCGGVFADADLYVGNSGTTIRLLSGLVSGKAGIRELSGDDSILKRPMNRVIEPLKKMGAQIGSADGKAPLKIIGQKLAGITYTMPVASAQVKSAILLAGLSASGKTTVIEKEKSRDHTERMLKSLGADISVEENQITICGGALLAKDFTVCGDISSAAYPMVLAAIRGKATISEVGINPTRTGILEVFNLCGAQYKISDERGDCEPLADINVFNSEMNAFSLGKDIMPRLIDEIPIIAVLACFCKGRTVISGAEELKVKESNRIDSTVNMLKSFGADICSTDDGMIINGTGRLKGGCVIDPMGDHRIAMSAAIAGACSECGCEILNPDCADVSYPGFYKDILGLS